MKQKTCSKCRVAKAIGEFSRQTKRLDGLQQYCTLCSRAAKRKHMQKRGRELDKLKDRPCLDCYERFPPECMDFDHVRGEKLFGIVEARGSAIAWQTVLNEIAKCDLVCANCHRMRTYIRRATG